MQQNLKLEFPDFVITLEEKGNERVTIIKKVDEIYRSTDR